VSSRSGASNGPNLGSLLDDAVATHPERPALYFRDAALTYRELDAKAERLAAALAGAGGAAGVRIGVIGANEPALVAALFAVWRLGATAVPLSARLREDELRRLLGDSEVTLLVSAREVSGYSFEQVLPGLFPDLPSLRRCLFLRPDGDVDATLETEASGPEPEPLAADVAAVLYTSGTTGAPKGVLVPHERELFGAGELASLLELTHEDTVALVIALVHAFGLTCLLAAISAGAGAALVESTFSTGPLLAAIEARRASVLHGPPILFAGLLKARPSGVPGIRTGFVAGASSPPDLLERLDSAGMRILNLYGLTEAGAVAACRPDDPPQVRYATVGRALPGIEARVERADTLQQSVAKSENETALRELQVRGEHVVPRYLRAWAAEDALADGWFRTGDLGEIEDGNIRIVGRSKELVHVGGFNVFPSEVEAVLLAHPDVVQAAVVGIPDEKMGEALQAFVVARPGAQLDQGALLRFARAKIAGYKLPYAIRIVPELPVLASGKPDRVALAGAARAGSA
jgi:long-chain acyl-CoA synthetase